LSANSNLEPGTKVPAGQLWSGNPAQYLRDVSPEEMNILTSNADDLSELASMHAVESSKSFSQIMEERAKFKELKEKLGRDSIQNPTINYFDDRPGVIFHKEEAGDVTYTQVSQTEIDERTFNRHKGIRVGDLDNDELEKAEKIKRLGQ
jgi:hypothetical protein